MSRNEAASEALIFAPPGVTCWRQAELLRRWPAVGSSAH
jgi:hypothetical protein